MASLRKESDRGRTGWRLQFRQTGKRRSLWLGPLSKRAADAVARHIEELVRAAAANVPPAAEAEVWARDVDDRIHETLHRWGLVEARLSISADARLCRVFFDSWIRENCPNSRTENNYRQAVGWFERRFGNNRTLSSITPAEFGSWHRWMTREAGLAATTAGKHAKRLRTLFRNAIDARLLDKNPGEGTKLGSEVNRSRDHYVSLADTESILNECDTEWAAIFGLCRFAGLRCPSEVTELRWSDIDWDAGRIRIDSRKTGLRFCPLWPRLRPLLDAAWDAAPDGAQFVVSRHRDRESNLRTQFSRIVQRAGLVPWSKPFVNLRASCRTDLEERFPSHVCDAWMGHSSVVAARHYLQVTAAHWETAIQETDSHVTATGFGGVTGGVISAHPGQSRAVLTTENTEKMLCLASADVSGREEQYARTNALRNNSRSNRQSAADI